MATKSGDQGLRDWFGKSKSSDGKPGWVQLGGKYAGKPCARQPGQTSTPKCGSSKMKRNLNAKEEERARRRKNRQDPNQPEKSGGAKPTNVRTEGMDIQEVKDKPGKGSGKKDACYHKVKSRYSVWPSAYASGALVKCRKAGASNWGNKSESYEFSNWRDDFQPTEYEFFDVIKAEPIKGGQSVDENVSSGRSRIARSGRVQGKTVGAVTNAEHSAELKKQKEAGKAKDKAVADKTDTSGLSPAEALMRKKQAERKAERERLKSEKKAEKERFKGGRFARIREDSCPICNEDPCQCLEGTLQEKKKEETNIGGGNLKKLTKKAVKRIDYDVDGDVDPDDKIEKKKGEYGEEIPTPFGKFRTKVKKEEFSNWRTELDEGAAWTKKSGKSESGGLNEKGRKSYERENPGSDLKAPSKKVGNPRRASFCARMKGMKKKLTSSKTANDPDSRINKSLRAWNC